MREDNVGSGVECGTDRTDGCCGVGGTGNELRVEIEHALPHSLPQRLGHILPYRPRKPYRNCWRPELAQTLFVLPEHIRCVVLVHRHEEQAVDAIHDLGQGLYLGPQTLVEPMYSLGVVRK